MSTTVPDIRVGNDQCIDALDVAGITAGAKVRLQNKGGHDLFVQYGANQPDSNSRDGIKVPPGTFHIVETEGNIWCIADVEIRVNIEEVA